MANRDPNMFFGFRSALETFTKTAASIESVPKYNLPAQSPYTTATVWPQVKRCEKWTVRVEGRQMSNTPLPQSEGSSEQAYFVADIDQRTWPDKNARFWHSTISTSIREATP